MADIVDVLKKIAEQRRKEGKTLAGAPGSGPSTGNTPIDPITHEPMEERDIYYNGNFVATLDFCKSNKAWFLDLNELNKLLEIPNIVSIIQAEENK